MADAELLAAASKPKRVTVDNLTVEQHSLKDQMELDRYLHSQENSSGSGNAIKRIINRFRFRSRGPV